VSVAHDTVKRCYTTPSWAVMSKRFPRPVSVRSLAFWISYSTIALHLQFERWTAVWIKDGQQLTDNQHYQINIYSTSDEFTTTSLRVLHIEKKQYGNYTCRAFNKLSAAQATIELFETVNVICPPACDDLYTNTYSASDALPSLRSLRSLPLIVPTALAIASIARYRFALFA
jgi:hypothetical protein